MRRTQKRSGLWLLLSLRFVFGQQERACFTAGSKAVLKGIYHSSAYSFASPFGGLFHKCTRVLFLLLFMGKNIYGEIQRIEQRIEKSRLPNSIRYAIICSGAIVLQGCAGQRLV